MRIDATLVYFMLKLVYLYPKVPKVFIKLAGRLDVLFFPNVEANALEAYHSSWGLAHMEFEDDDNSPEKKKAPRARQLEWAFHQAQLPIWSQANTWSNMVNQC